MAEKRMFTQKITDSDAFLDMPLSTQALYFHLNMMADDDGFINNPKRIQRTIGASEDDLKLLIAKRFVICFENGVIVIKHWLMHNTLRKDRYKPTQYQEQFATLSVKANNAYTEKRPESMATDWQPNGNQTEPQCSVDKCSVDKCSVDKCRLVDGSIEEREEEIERDKIDYKGIVATFNSVCVSFPSVMALSDARKRAIKARLNNYSVEDFKTLFEKAEASSFLKGKNSSNWSATFDWLIKDSNMAKVLDGNYDDKKGAGNSGTNSGNHEKIYGECL